MIITELHNKTVAILGFGMEGRSVASFLSLKGIKATIFEAKPENEWDEAQKNLIDNLGFEIISGDNYLSELKNYAVIVRSPGFWRLHPDLLEAERNGSEITSQTKIFFDNTPASIIGITGTKGKGTTSSLIYSMLNESKSSGELKKSEIYLTGNIGKMQPLDFLDSLTEKDIVVYELSSFQLQDLKSSPDIGICLMVTSDHLNHHESLEEYHQAKSAISKYQKADQKCIYNVDYPASKEIGSQGMGEKYIVSQTLIDAPGAYINDESITLKRPESDDITINCTGRKLRGKHNMENIAAASMASLLKGVSKQVITKSIIEFKGLEYRLEFVGTINEVSYYNDSISTVPETTIAAINSFTEPILLIIGGSEKGTSYEELADFICNQKQIKAVALLGETGIKIGELLRSRNYSNEIIEKTQDFDGTLKAVTELASAGDIVLLSPASASFGMFKNYADRGKQFNDYVESLNKI